METEQSQYILLKTETDNQNMTRKITFTQILNLELQTVSIKEKIENEVITIKIIEEKCGTRKLIKLEFFYSKKTTLINLL